MPYFPPRMIAKLRHFRLCLLVALAGCWIMGCSQYNDNEESEFADFKPPLGIKIKLDKPTYRLGEAVVCTAEITNLLDDEVRILLPYAYRLRIDSNVNFWLKADGATDALRRVPVHPPEPTHPLRIDISPGATKDRKFVFVNLTEIPGVFQLQARYSSGLNPPGGAHTLISPMTAFKVTGPRRWTRDSQGILTKADAVRIAEMKYGKPVKGVLAALVENEKGLLDWWVTLVKMPFDVGSAEDDRIAYYVSPYLCTVSERRQATPARQSLNEDKS